MACVNRLVWPPPCCYRCGGVSDSCFVGVRRALLIPEVADVASASCRLTVFDADNTRHSEMELVGPPTISTLCNSASLPSTVPWYRDSSPVLLCFFLIASHFVSHRASPERRDTFSPVR